MAEKKMLQVIPRPNEVSLTGGSIAADRIRIASVPVALDTALPEEGYCLHIASDGAAITAGGKAGVFYAQQTLRQLLQPGAEIPCAQIQDVPVYQHRGVLLDCARHMMRVESIKRFVDAMALLKLNVLHWHLTDDQGWRIPVGRYPKLISVGSIRPRSTFGQYRDETPHSGFFTREEIQEVVEYCTQRHIDVIPEIDMPGHMNCAIAAYPELSCEEKQIPIRTNQGVSEDILCAGKDAVMNFCRNVLADVISLFPGKYVHIGGDEVPKVRWKKCPHCQKRMQEHGLKNEEQLQGWFNQEMQEFLRRHGKTMILWNEGLYNGMMDTDIVAQRWFDRKHHVCADFANQGGKIILSDDSYCYFDYPYGRTPLKKAYSYARHLKGITDENQQNVLGMEATLWAEYIADFDRLCYMAFPRLCAFAENAWTVPRMHHYRDFAARLDSFLPQLTAMGIRPVAKRGWNPNPIRQLVEMAKFQGGYVMADYPMEIPENERLS